MILQVLLYDQYFNLKKEVNNYFSLYWEYARTGGCGQAVLIVMQNLDTFEADFKPKTSIKVVVDGVVRYHGRVLKVLRSIQSGQEVMQVVFYGFMSELEKIIVREDYSNMEVSMIVKDIMDNYVVGASDITYVSADVEATSYVVQALSFNHTVKDAFALLAQLGGNIEWGIDRNRQLFWKQTDQYVRRVYVVGRELTTYSEERSNEGVINKLNIFGGAGYISTVQSGLSIEVFGTNEGNHYESAITEASDSNQLGQVLLKQLSKIQRRVQFEYVSNDVFIESSVPLGSTAVSKSQVPRLNKYATFKYGTVGIKYGNFTQDQINLIRYTLEGGGMRVQIALEEQIPSLSTQQKQIEYQIRELQRR